MSSERNEAELGGLFRYEFIDFSGDGVSGEYGNGYISLEPIPESISPLSSIHTLEHFVGTALRFMAPTMKNVLVKKSRSCINVNNMSLSMILSAVQTGDEVVITSTGGCVS